MESDIAGEEGSIGKIAKQRGNNEKEKRARSTTLVGTILMLTAGSVFGVGDIFTKSVYNSGVNLPFNFSIVRLWISLLVYLVLIAYSGLLPKLAIPPKLLWRPFIYGVMVAAFTGFFLTSIEHTSVANATLLIYTAPIYLAIIGRLWLSETLTREKIIGIILALVGAAFVIGVPTGMHLFDSTHFLGDSLAAVAGVATAGVFVAGKIQSQKVDSKIVAFYGFLFASLILLPVAVVTEGFDLAGLAPGLPFILGSALASSLAYLITLLGLKRIEATKASIYSLMEPIVASLLAALILSEAVDEYTVIGGLLIVAAVIVIYIRSPPEKKPTGESSEELPDALR